MDILSQITSYLHAKQANFNPSKVEYKGIEKLLNKVSGTIANLQMDMKFADSMASKLELSVGKVIVGVLCTIQNKVQ